MANPEDVWWRLPDGIPVILTRVHRGRAYWEAFDGTTGSVTEPSFISTHRPIEVIYPPKIDGPSNSGGGSTS